MKQAHVVASIDELNFFLRRFAPRIQLRVSPDAVIATTPEAEMRVPASISFTREGRGEILGIGDEVSQHPDSVTVRLFSPAGMASPGYDNLLDKFLRLVLQRVPRSGSFIRPIVLVEGLNSLPRDIGKQIRESLVRALPNGGAAAIVIDPGAN